MQGTARLAGGDLLLRLLRRLKSLLAKAGHKGIQARVQALKSIEHRSSDLYRGDVLPTNLLRDVAQRSKQQVMPGHPVSSPSTLAMQSSLLKRDRRLAAALSAILQRHIWHVHGANVLGQRAQQNVVRKLLHHLQCPARNPAHGKNGDEQVFGDTEQIVDRASVEIDVHTDALGG